MTTPAGRGTLPRQKDALRQAAHRLGRVLRQTAIPNKMLRQRNSATATVNTLAGTRHGKVLQQYVRGGQGCALYLCLLFEVHLPLQSAERRELPLAWSGKRFGLTQHCTAVIQLADD